LTALRKNNEVEFLGHTQTDLPAHAQLDEQRSDRT